MSDTDVVDELRHLVEDIHMHTPLATVVARGRSRRRRRSVRLGAGCLVVVCVLVAAGALAARGDSNLVRVEGEGSQNPVPTQGEIETWRLEGCALRNQVDELSRRLTMTVQQLAEAQAESPVRPLEVQLLEDEQTQRESELVAALQAQKDHAERHRAEGLVCEPASPSTISNVNRGSGIDGSPTAEQEQKLRIQLADYDPAEVQHVRDQTNGTVDNQGLVGTLEFRRACRETRRAVDKARAVNAESPPRIIDEIMNPVVQRLIDREPSDSLIDEVFAQFATQIKNGETAGVLNWLEGPAPGGNCTDALAWTD